MARPRFKPTTDQRRIVKSMAAYGIPQPGIATILGLRSVKTLRRHFRQELDRGAIEANTQVAQSLFKMATSGKVAAAIFWMKTRGRWREGGGSEEGAQSPPPFLVALEKKAA